VGLSLEIVKVLQPHHSCSKKSAVRGPRKSQTTTRRFRSIFEVGGTDLFWKSKEKEAHSTRSRAVVCASRSRGDPDSREGRLSLAEPITHDSNRQ
jgi:hypothetical protein